MPIQNKPNVRVAVWSRSCGGGSGVFCEDCPLSYDWAMAHHWGVRIVTGCYTGGRSGEAVDSDLVPMTSVMPELTFDLLPSPPIFRGDAV